MKYIFLPIIITFLFIMACSDNNTTDANKEEPIEFDGYISVWVQYYDLEKKQHWYNISGDIINKKNNQYINAGIMTIAGIDYNYDVSDTNKNDTYGNSNINYDDLDKTVFGKKVVFGIEGNADLGLKSFKDSINLFDDIKNIKPDPLTEIKRSNGLRIKWDKGDNNPDSVVIIVHGVPRSDSSDIDIFKYIPNTGEYYIPPSDLKKLSVNILVVDIKRTQIIKKKYNNLEMTYNFMTQFFTKYYIIE